MENNLNKGFGFVQFSTWEEARAAIDKLNGTKYKGRTIAVDFSIAKHKYVEKIGAIADKVAEKKAKKAPQIIPEDDEKDSEGEIETEKVPSKPKILKNKVERKEKI